MLGSLIFLFLTNNLLNNIKVGLFDHSPQLAYLYLDGNNLTKIPKAMFKNNLKLEELSLEKNRIIDIENGTFDYLFSLRMLNLDNNMLFMIGKTQDNYKFTSNCNNNLLQSYVIGSLQEEVNICNNSITTLQCGNASTVRVICVKFILNFVLKFIKFKNFISDKSKLPNKHEVH